MCGWICWTRIMGKMMGLASILRMLDATRSSSCPPSPASPLWACPSCKHPRTSSFRDGEDMYKTVNSIYFDATDASFPANPWQQTRSSSSSPSSSPSAVTVEEEVRRRRSFSRAVEESQEEEEASLVDIIKGLRSDRLFFEPEDKTISVLGGGEPKTIASIEETVVAAGGRPEETAAAAAGLFKESVVEEMESEDPYLDFRASMEEMVVAYGLNDWERLEELLGWYLRMNGKKTHAFILGAFVDLILDLASSFRPPAPSSCSSCSCSRSCSSTTTASSSSDKFAGKMKREEDRPVA